ncbi:hypothetical protein AALP_AA8G244500 [Arabis alpina]|nr:hypothetical protein AALP_AA8G244500 [Arabis alpina]
MISELEPDGCGAGVMNRVGPDVTVNQSDPDTVMIGTDEATKGSDPDVSTGREEGRPTSPPCHDDDPTSSLRHDIETPRSSPPRHGDDPTSVPRGDIGTPRSSPPRHDYIPTSLLRCDAEADDDDVEAKDSDVESD